MTSWNGNISVNLMLDRRRHSFECLFPYRKEQERKSCRAETENRRENLLDSRRKNVTKTDLDGRWKSISD